MLKLPKLLRRSRYSTKILFIPFMIRYILFSIQSNYIKSDIFNVHSLLHPWLVFVNCLIFFLSILLVTPFCARPQTPKKLRFPSKCAYIRGHFFNFYHLMSCTFNQNHPKGWICLQIVPVLEDTFSTFLPSPNTKKVEISLKLRV